jgi:hypothetical protein
MSNETVVRGEQTLRDLEQKRAKLSARADKIADERKALGFRVFAEGDAKARKTLDSLNAEGASLAGELQAIEAAILEAERRVQLAKQADEAAENRAKAEQIRAVMQRANERTRTIDNLLEKASQEAKALSLELAEMRKLGAEFSQAALLSNMDLALRTWIMKLPGSWGRDFGAVAPAMRRSFGGFFASMTAGIEAGIRRRLGEADPEPAPKPNPPVTKPSAASASGNKKPSQRSVPADWIKEAGPEPRTEPKVPRGWLKDNQPTPQPPGDWAEKQKQEVV